MYIQLHSDDTYWRHIRENRNFLWDDTHFCPPETLTIEEAVYFRVHPLELTARPDINPLTEDQHESDPLLVNGVWTQTWLTTVLDESAASAKRIKATDLKWGKIKIERDSRKNGGTFVSNKWFHSDSDSRIQQLGLVLMGANVPAVQWKTMDGSFITMSQALAGGIFQATATLDMQLFEVAENHRTAMEASERPDLYDFSAGWPARYSE